MKKITKYEDVGILKDVEIRPNLSPDCLDSSNSKCEKYFCAQQLRIAYCRFAGRSLWGTEPGTCLKNPYFTNKRSYEHQIAILNRIKPEIYWTMEIFSSRRWRGIGPSRNLLCLCKTPKIMQLMHGIIPWLFDCWVDPAVLLLLLKSSFTRPFDSH